MNAQPMNTASFKDTSSATTVDLIPDGSAMSLVDTPAMINEHGQGPFIHHGRPNMYEWDPSQYPSPPDGDESTPAFLRTPRQFRKAMSDDANPERRPFILPRSSTLQSVGTAPATSTAFENQPNAIEGFDRAIAFIHPAIGEEGHQYTEAQIPYLRESMTFEFPHARRGLSPCLFFDHQVNAYKLSEEAQQRLEQALANLPFLASGSLGRSPYGMYIEPLTGETLRARIWLGADSFLMWSGSGLPVGLFIFDEGLWVSKLFKTFDYPPSKDVDLFGDIVAALKTRAEGSRSSQRAFG